RSLHHGRKGGVVSEGLPRVFTHQPPPIGFVLPPASVNVPVIGHPGEFLDFPPEQLAVKLLCPLGIVSRDFKPDDARRRASSLRVFRLCFLLCAHSYLSVG